MQSRLALLFSGCAVNLCHFLFECGELAGLIFFAHSERYLIQGGFRIIRSGFFLVLVIAVVAPLVKVMRDVIATTLCLALLLRLPLFIVFVSSGMFKLGRLMKVVTSKERCGLCFTVTR